MQVEPIVLEGREVRLLPLAESHIAGLWDAATPATFTYLLDPTIGNSPDSFARYVRNLISDPTWCPFAVVQREGDRLAGISCYLDIRPAHRGLEIGGTWYGPAFQGTRVNPEAKYLLLRHAFERLGAVRVQLKTDGRNLRSQHAIAKLGAQREGVLRKHTILADGYIRDTVMFSILDSEWPVVKAGLEARLGYVPPGS